jgi:photosystem II stability/assembly factor-like uncharacterized protein
VRDEIDSNAITATLNDIDGKDPNILAMVGDYGTILYTNDGGSSWTQSFIGTNEHLKGISFFDKLNATAVGRDGVILKTTDGGKDWFFVPQTPEFTTMYSVAFPKGDTSLGIAVGQQGTIKRTTNGGKLWTVISSGTPNTLHCVTFSDSITAYCVGDYGTVLKSKDGGLTWNSLQSTTTRNLYSISFATANDGLAVGDTNTILRTYTSGQFWTHEFPPTSKDTDKMLMVSYPDSKHAFLMGFYNLYSTADGGISWNNILGHNGQLYPAVSFVDSLHGAILGSDNPAHIVYWFAKFTSNGGLTWNTILTPDNVPLNDIQCVDKLHATIVGHGGYIGHTSDGGITINQQVSNTVNNLYGVGFGSVLAGNAVGIRGNIMRITTDDIPVSFVKESPGMGPRVVFEGNYPNPFNTSTIIKYSLPLPGISTIEIFSIEGKLIATLETEYQSLGDHSIRFERAALSAGTYICRITNNGMRAEGKIIVEN